MINKVIGGVMLLLGICIGGGILALPMATAPGGFWGSSLLLIACWALMTFTAFLILEANLWFAEHSNIISMAKATLGPWGKSVAWLSYALLLYAVLCAYLSGASDVFNEWFGISTKIAPWLIVLILGAVIYLGVAVVDYVNRSILSLKLLLLVAVIAIVLPLTHFSNVSLTHEHPAKLLPAVMVIITSFGYSTLVPTLRYYFKSNIKMLRLAVLLGSTIPLVLYILWDFAIHASIPQVAIQTNSISGLTNGLVDLLQKPVLNTIVRLFTSICVFTSFLGAGLCLVDFLSDGLGVKKIGFRKLGLHALTFLPPLIIVVKWPDIFVAALRYAGTLCVILLVLLPTLMVWRGRYVKRYPSQYQVMGGKMMLILSLLLSVVLLLISVGTTFHLI